LFIGITVLIVLPVREAVLGAFWLLPFKKPAIMPVL
jgi:hypothetical protein